MVMEFTFALEFTFSSQQNLLIKKVRCYGSHPAKKRRAANNNTLRVAQKRKKAPFAP